MQTNTNTDLMHVKDERETERDERRTERRAKRAGNWRDLRQARSRNWQEEESAKEPTGETALEKRVANKQEARSKPTSQASTGSKLEFEAQVKVRHEV
jgi:hypothetical protein